MSKRKIALVTGGSRGLGRNMAVKLANKGLDIVITYNSNESAAQETLGQIQEQGGRGIAMKLDTTAIASFPTFREQLRDQLKQTWEVEKIDYLINNAGFGLNASIAETAEKDFDALVNVHFKGVYFLTQGLLDTLIDEGGIINISSGLARFSFPGYAAYACMKGAIEVFTRYLAKELGARKIRANTVAPGAIYTDFNKERFDQAPGIVDYISGLTALGRVGESDDIGSIVAFLCTNDAYWVNGERIEASGGMLL